MSIPTLEQLLNLTDAELLAKFTRGELAAARDRLRQGDTGAPGFLARLGAGFATTPEGEASIYRTMGYPAGLRDNQVMRNTLSGPVAVDPRGLDVGDIADVVGEIPAIVGGAVGATGGAIIPVPGGTYAGAAAGSGLGDLARQKIGQWMGSGERTDYARAGLEAALGAAGDIPGKVGGKLLRGAFKHSTTAPDFARTMQQLSDFDVKFGTELAQLAPVDVQSGSSFLGNLTQRVRESQFGGEALRRGQDIPFERELESGFEAIRKQSGAYGPLGATGPLATPIGEGAAGRDLRAAAQNAMGARRGQVSQAYRQFGEQVAGTTEPSMANTTAAIQDILNTNVIKRKKTGGQGVEGLRTAISEAEAITSFDELTRLRQAVSDEIDLWEGTRLTKGVQAQLKKLWGALKADEDAFLASGGGGVAADPGLASQLGQKARRAASDLYELDDASVGRRVFRDELKLSEIPTALPRMNADEIQALRRIVGVEGTPGGLVATAEGRTAWEQIAAEVLDDLKQVAKNTDKSTADHYVISGAKLQGALDKYKPGVLEGVFGAETAIDLRHFAELARNVSVSERQFANVSRTGMANQSILNDLARFFTDPTGAAGRITGRIFAERGAGVMLGSAAGKRALLGQTRLQSMHPGVLSLIGRVGGQSVAHGLPRMQGAR